MAAYLYTDESGQNTVERNFAMGSAPSKVKHEGRVYWRDIAAEQAGVKKAPAVGGVWQLSRANGITGDENILRQNMALDAKLGVPISYRKTHETTNVRGNKVAAYAAVFDSAAQKNQWLRAHKRVDYDAGYNAPCPGDFVKNHPGEFDR